MHWSQIKSFIYWTAFGNSIKIRFESVANILIQTDFNIYTFNLYIQFIHNLTFDCLIVIYHLFVFNIFLYLYNNL